MKINEPKTIIILIIIFSITIFILTNSIFNLSSVETFNNDYTNICKSQQTQYYLPNSQSYQIGSTIDLNVVDSNNIPINVFSKCSNLCNEKSNCDLFTIESGQSENIKQCKLYNLAGLSESNKIQINCNNKSTNNINGYIGEGYIKHNFYKTNKNKLEYNNYLNNKAKYIQSQNEKVLDLIDDLSANYSRIDSNQVIEKRNEINTYYNNITNQLNKVGYYLDVERNKIYSPLVHDNDYSAFQDNNPDLSFGNWFSTINVNGTDISYVMFIEDLDKKYKKKEIMQSKLNDIELNNKSNINIFMIMLIILIISVFLLYSYIVNKNSISSFIIISYFIGVTLMLYFVNKHFRMNNDLRFNF